MISLRDRRLELGYTQKDISAILGVDQTTVSTWELGKCFPYRKYWKRVARAYQIDEKELEELKPNDKKHI